MLPDRVSNPGPLTYESGALLIALRGPARQLSSKEAKGPVSLCANTTDMCVPFQIVCNGYTKIFDFLNIIKERSL